MVVVQEAIIGAATTTPTVTPLVGDTQITIQPLLLILTHETKKDNGTSIKSNSNEIKSKIRTRTPFSMYTMSQVR